MKKLFTSAIILVFAFLLLEAEAKISSFKLHNGLRVILSPIEDIQAACVLLYHLTGARDDPVEAKGGSSLYKNLMFLRTMNLDPYEHIRFVKKNGGFNYATINYDSSVFYQVIPDTQINYALWLEKERISSLYLTDRNINILKNTIYRRIYSLTNANVNFRATSWVKSKIFEGTIYQIPLYGSVEEIRNLSNLSIRDIYNNFRSLPDIILVVTGKFDETDIRKIINKHFGQLSFRKRNRREEYVSIKPRKEYINKNWLEKNLKRYLVVYGIRAPSKFSFDHIYFDFIKYYLVDERISKLEKLLNKTYKLDTNISYEYTDYFESNAFIITLSTEQRINFEKAKYFFNKELQSMMNKSLSSSEVKTIKSLMEIDFNKKMASIEERSIFLAEYFHLTGDLNFEKVYLKRVKNINAYDIIRIGKKYLNKENRVILNVYKK